MPSSKFNRLPVPRLRPAICFPPPGSCRQLFLDAQPPWVVGRYKWKDWHPPTPIDWWGHVEMQYNPAGHDYEGVHTFHGGCITMKLSYVMVPMLYICDLRVFIVPDQYLIHTWWDIEPHSIGHIDTGNLTMVNEPDIDYREARVVG